MWMLFAVDKASVSVHVCGRKMLRRLQLTKESGSLGQKVSHGLGCRGETNVMSTISHIENI